MVSNHADLIARNKTYTLSSWTAQSAWNPISMTRAEGVPLRESAVPTALIRSCSMTTVMPGCGPAPLPSMTVTLRMTTLSEGWLQPIDSESPRMAISTAARFTEILPSQSFAQMIARPCTQSLLFLRCLQFGVWLRRGTEVRPPISSGMDKGGTRLRLRLRRGKQVPPLQRSEAVCL